MNAVVMSVSSVSAAASASRSAAFSAMISSIFWMAVESPVASMLSLQAFSFLRTFFSLMFLMKLKGIL